MSSAGRHGAVLMAAYIVTSVLNYAFSVGLSWFFTPAEYGVLGVAQSLLLLAALAVGSGFAWTANHDLASAGLNDHTRQRFRAALLINAVMGLLLAAGLWGAYASGLLPLGPGYETIVPLVGLTVALLAVRAVVNGAARGLYAFTPVALNLVGEVLVKLLVGLWLASLGAGATGVLAGFAIGAGLSLLHSLWAVRRAQLFQGGSRLTTWFDSRITADTLPLFAGMLGVALMLNLDVLGLKLFSQSSRGDELAGFYQAAVILARTPVFLAQALTLVLFSYASSASLPGETASPAARAGEYLRAAVKAWTRLLLPGGLLLLLAPQAALRLFFPLRYQQGELVLQIASIGGVLLALVTLLSGVLQAGGQAANQRRSAALAAGLAVAVQLTVLVWTVPSWGAMGAALSLIAAGLVALLALSPAVLSLVARPASLRGARPAPESGTPLRQISTAGMRLLQKAVKPAAALLALAVPLLIIPDHTRWLALLQFTISVVAYLSVVAAFSLRHSPAQGSPGSSGTPTQYPRRAVLALARALFGG